MNLLEFTLNNIRNRKTGKDKKVLFSQYTQSSFNREGKACEIDEAEKRNFLNSKYIPGNSKYRKLGRK